MVLGWVGRDYRRKRSGCSMTIWPVRSACSATVAVPGPYLCGSSSCRLIRRPAPHRPQNRPPLGQQDPVRCVRCRVVLCETVFGATGVPGTIGSPQEPQSVLVAFRYFSAQAGQWGAGGSTVNLQPWTVISNGAVAFSCAQPLFSVGCGCCFFFPQPNMASSFGVWIVARFQIN